MQEYDIRRGHHSKIEGDRLEELVKEIFGTAKKNNDDSIETMFGALEKLRVWPKEKKTLVVDTIMKTDVSDSDARDTIKKYNDFLERATGYNAKERSKRMQKKAKDGKL